MTGLKASTLFRAYIRTRMRWSNNGKKMGIDFRKMLRMERAMFDKLEAQEKELELLRGQVEQFKPAFILQEIRAGNVTEVENVDN